MGHVVIVGGGQAAIACAAKLRAEGHSGAITMICGEPVPPYQRPPLSKGYLLGELTRERLFLRPEAFYAEHDITLRLSTRATAIHREAGEVELEAGERLAYDDLVLATGAHPRGLATDIGGMLDGVFTMRDLADADAMAPYFTEGQTVLVVGGGYIGLEAAAVARKRGVKVVLIELAERILNRVAAPVTADWFRELHRGNGVEIREGLGLERLDGLDHVERATLSDGTGLDIDFCVLGIGIAPATLLAETAGLEIDNGIATDRLGRTSDPHIWAAGDCASLIYRGERVRLESVQNAIDQGEAVACNIMGAETDYAPSPWFWSDQYDTKLQIAGLNRGYDRVIVRPGAQDGAVSHWYYCGDDLRAVDAMNAPRDYMVGKRLLEMGKSPDAETVADPEADLKALLRG